MSARAPRIAILGAGRAGCSLFDNLGRANYPLLALTTRSETTARAARAERFEVQVAPAAEAVRGAELVFLAVSDGAVEPLAKELAGSGVVGRGTVVAHLSGSLDLGPLSALAASGASLGSLHPLVSIATRRTRLEGAWAAVEGSDPRAAATLEAVARRLGLHVLRPKGDRARYHAAACLVGNYPQVLMEAAVRLLAGCGVAPEEGRAAMGALLQGASANAATLPGAEALTGPISRGDAEVVRRHLASMHDEAAVEALYRAGAVIAAELARSSHPAQSDTIRQLVSDD